MPQASSELQSKMREWFGDATSDVGPMVYLKSRRFTLTPQWSWTLPFPEYMPTQKEIDCVNFLMQEWDMDGIDYPPQHEVWTAR